MSKLSSDQKVPSLSTTSKCRIFSVRLQYFDDDLLSHVMLMEPRPKFFQGISIVSTKNNVTHVVPQSFALGVLESLHVAGYYSDDQFQNIEAYIKTIWDGQDVVMQEPQKVQLPPNFKLN